MVVAIEQNCPSHQSQRFQRDIKYLLAQTLCSRSPVTGGDFYQNHFEYTACWRIRHLNLCSQYRDQFRVNWKRGLFLGWQNNYLPSKSFFKRLQLCTSSRSGHNSPSCFRPISKPNLLHQLHLRQGPLQKWTEHFNYFQFLKNLMERAPSRSKCTRAMGGVDYNIVPLKKIKSRSIYEGSNMFF